MIAQIINDNCMSCGQCIDACPAEAVNIDLSDLGNKSYKPMKVDKKACVGCEVCMLECPAECIIMVEK